MKINYKTATKLLTYSLGGGIIAFGGVGVLLPAIFAIESAFIWLFIPTALAVIILSLLFCVQQIISIVKDL